MHTYRIVLASLSVALLISSCAGDRGPRGNEGDPGVPGNAGSPDTADDVRTKFFAGTACPGSGPDDVMVKVGSICVDRYEASIWSAADGTGTEHGVAAGQTPFPSSFPPNGNWTAPLYAVSKPGVLPAVGVTWFQAMQACALSGKRLLTNVEWQTAAAGTPDTGTGVGDAPCQIFGAALVATGSKAGCISSWGVNDMVGNAQERVADRVQGGTTPFAAAAAGSATSAAYGLDAIGGHNPAQFDDGDDMMPSIVRGGFYGDQSFAGVFNMYALYSPALATSADGFRCAK